MSKWAIVWRVTWILVCLAAVIFLSVAGGAPGYVACWACTGGIGIGDSFARINAAQDRRIEQLRDDIEVLKVKRDAIASVRRELGL